MSTSPPKACNVLDIAVAFCKHHVNLTPASHVLHLHNTALYTLNIPTPSSKLTSLMSSSNLRPPIHDSSHLMFCSTTSSKIPPFRLSHATPRLGPPAKIPDWRTQSRPQRNRRHSSNLEAFLLPPHHFHHRSSTYSTWPLCSPSTLPSESTRNFASLRNMSST
jgi:hypothetical protein